MEDMIYLVYDCCYLEDQLEQSKKIVYLVYLVAAMVVMEERIAGVTPYSVMVLILSVMAFSCLQGMVRGDQ